MQLDGFSTSGNDVETLCCQNTRADCPGPRLIPVFSFCRVDMFVYVSSDFFVHQLEPAVKVLFFLSFFLP